MELHREYREVVLAKKSDRELEADIASCLSELSQAESLEDAARRRHDRENRPETDRARNGRRKLADRARGKYRLLVRELGRRNES